VINAGEIDPGNSPGTMTIYGDYTQQAGGVLNLEVGPSGWDVLDVHGNLILNGGILNVLAWGTWPSTGSYTFDVLHWTGSLSGAFGSINLPTVAGYAFSTRWDSHDLWVLASAIGGESGVPEPGTFLLAGAGLLLALCWRKK
jgi:hypothetical protein